MPWRDSDMPRLISPLYTLVSPRADEVFKSVLFQPGIGTLEAKHESEEQNSPTHQEVKQELKSMGLAAVGATIDFFGIAASMAEYNCQVFGSQIENEEFDSDSDESVDTLWSVWRRRHL